MRALIRILFASSLSLTLTAVPGCKDNGGGTSNAGTVDKPDRVAGMPKPYRIPANPELAAYVEHPDQALAAAQVYGQGMLPRGRGLLLEAMSASPEDFDRQLAQMVDLTKPWAGVYIENQNILWLPIETASIGKLEGLLSSKPAEGKFGAVSLQRAAAGPKLAWLSEKDGYLALADDDKGLATAQSLPFELSKKGGLYVTITTQHASRFVSGVPFSRATIEGAGPHDFTLTTEDTDTSQAPDLAKLVEGSMGGIFEAKQVAAGVSTKYKDYDAWTKSTLSQVRREINKAVDNMGVAGAFAKGNLDDLHRRLGSMLRSWNGKLAAGVGPKRHLLLGFGADDPKKMAGATQRFLQGIRDNVSTARTFGINVNNVKFNKNRTSAAGTNVMAFVVERAKSVLPKEYHSLVHEGGDLRIAMAFPPHAGGAMVVIGPNAPTVMERWLEATKSSTPASETASELAMATFSVAPSALEALSGADQRTAIVKALQLEANREPTRVSVSRKDARYTFRVKGPAIDPAAVTNTNTATRSAAAPRRAPARAASTPRRASGTPTRAAHRAAATRTKTIH